ncbi:MAG: chorismate mutase [Candidatus Magasanikbacteria bacterium CG_4_10_14_0_2_um_filter_33_14]|uniref:prephenate dehydratase n=1 Tax=Candidatus Magasanikbacteria bacterium CG_4_10_14_0_2_um_filter_33_14 TaxID=1974636 RepID=A0A2M7VBG9_9BACT|nr:MAG: chorismate mutase [Candidatus Magasanikbacteria bacterium CG_4_10_14_0_2_um_filter_33_14]
MKIAVSGDIGSFSEEAGNAYAIRQGIKDYELVYAIDMEGVLDRVEKNEVDLGVFPVVNSRGGLVQTAFEAMGRHNFILIDELWHEVCQCLMVKTGIKLEEITKIVSHPQALSQCERTLDKMLPGVKFQEWEDTAKAARDLSEGKLENTCAIVAPARAAEIYGLEILQRNIQDMRPNLTTFIIVKKEN